MSVFWLALKNIRGNSARSLIIFLCVLGIASFFVSTTMVVRSAENSLQRGIERMGADILVVPQGAEAKVETALLMGRPTQVWMKTDFLQKVAGVPGVAAVSPQLYLQSLMDAACCSVSEMFMVIYDPATDFAVTPWLQKKLGRGLNKNEVIGGSYIFTPPGEQYIKLYGVNLTLKGNLEATGTGIDQTMFLTVDTARELAKSSLTTAVQPLEIPPDSISAVMVKVVPGANAHKVTLQILRDVVGVTPIESPNLFGTFRQQMMGLLWGFVTLLSIAWVLSAILIALIVSMAANERRREVAVLRSLGASRRFIFLSLMSESAMLALGAGLLGIILAASGLYIFRDMLAGSLRMPFLFPSFASLAVLFGGALLLALLTVTLSAFLPALNISREEPAVAMRE